VRKPGYNSSAGIDRARSRGTEGSTKIFQDFAAGRSENPDFNSWAQVSIRILQAYLQRDEDLQAASYQVGTLAQMKCKWRLRQIRTQQAAAQTVRSAALPAQSY
jgi:hypothetical protein